MQKKLKLIDFILLFMILPFAANVFAVIWGSVAMHAIQSGLGYTPIRKITGSMYFFRISLNYIIPFIVTSFFFIRYTAPIVRYFFNKLKSDENEELIKRRILNLPFVFGITSFGGWMIAFLGVVFDLILTVNILKDHIITTKSVTLDIFIFFIRMLFQGGLAFVITYYLLDSINRKYIIPNIFVNEKISKTSNTIRMSVTVKIGIYFFAVALCPIIYCTGVILTSWRGKNLVMDKLQIVILIILISFIVMGLILTFLLSKNFQKPLMEMESATKEIQNGNYETKIKIVSNDELGILGEAMNEMSEKLKYYDDENNEMYEKIMQLNRELEERIEERTRELKDANEKLLISEKMAAIGNLAGGIAHELNSPLGGVLTSAQMMKLDIEDLKIDNCNEIKSELQDGIDIIETGIKKSKEIISRLLDSRTMIKSGDERITKIDVEELVRVSLESLKDKIEKRKIEIILNNEKELKITGDLAELINVFKAILKNAIESIESKNIEVDGIIKIYSRLDDYKIYVEIEDNGVGMSEETKIKIFDPFFTTKGVGGGMGLGMTIAYDIIKKCGAKISVESVLGMGSKIIMEFPLN